MAVVEVSMEAVEISMEEVERKVNGRCFAAMKALKLPLLSNYMDLVCHIIGGFFHGRSGGSCHEKGGEFRAIGTSFGGRTGSFP